MKIQSSNNKPRLFKSIAAVSVVALSSAAALYMLSDQAGFYSERAGLQVLGDFGEAVPPGTAVFWEHPGFKGNSINMNVDTLADMDLRHQYMNDKISSF